MTETIANAVVELARYAVAEGKPGRVRSRVPALCRQCGKQYGRLKYRSTQEFCSKRCRGDWRKAQPRAGRQPTHKRRLMPGEPVPAGVPQRYQTSHGYIELRWKVAPHHYVVVREHRLVAGLTMPHVHHINGDKADNRPGNLMPMEARQHVAIHHPPTWDIELACQLYRDEGWSLPMLSRRFGKQPAQIRAALKSRGVVLRNLIEAQALRRTRHAC